MNLPQGNEGAVCQARRRIRGKGLKLANSETPLNVGLLRKCRQLRDQSVKMEAYSHDAVAEIFHVY